MFSSAGLINWRCKANRFMEDIAKPAAAFCSCNELLPWHISLGLVLDCEWYNKGIVRKRDMTHFAIMDGLTHQSIRQTKFKGLPDRAKIGNLLLVMHPALFWCGKEGERDAQIEKAPILIRVTVLLMQTIKPRTICQCSPGIKELFSGKIKKEGLDEKLTRGKEKYESSSE